MSTNLQDAAFTGGEIKITAQVDVGFGNELTIRGAGAGLSWNYGTPMACMGADQWTITLETDELVLFKFLVNDVTWCFGEDYIAKPGENVNVTPLF